MLDDNRLYRRTDPPPPTLANKSKTNSKKARAATRANKRRRTRQAVDTGDEDDENEDKQDSLNGQPTENGIEEQKWECIAITLADYQQFLSSIQKSRDANEKALHVRLTKEVLPIIEKAEESLLRKKQKQERELQSLQRMATAKRSSRLEAKFEREKQEYAAAEAKRKRQEDLAAAKLDQEKQRKLDNARQSRIMTREQRLKDREYKRILQEDELAKLAEENRKVEAGESRGSERHIKAEIEKMKRDLEALQEDDEWFFDCAKCGVHGNNVVSLIPYRLVRLSTDIKTQDDGTHSVACERCNVWQHSACLGITQEQAEKDDFHFICRDCKQREEDAKKPKIPTLKFHVNSSNPLSPQRQVNGTHSTTKGVKRKLITGIAGLPPTKKFKAFDGNRQHEHKANGSLVKLPGQQAANGMSANGSKTSSQGQDGSSLPLYAGNTSLDSSQSTAKAPGYVRKPKPKTQTSLSGNTFPPHTNLSTPDFQPSPYGGFYYQNDYQHPQAHRASQPLSQQPYPTQRAAPGSHWNHYQYPQTGNAKQSGSQQGSVGNQPLPPSSQQSHQTQRSSSILNPYANSFERQPASIHANQHVPPPLRNGFSQLSPPQHRSPPAVNGVRPPASLQPQREPQAHDHAVSAQGQPRTVSHLHPLPQSMVLHPDTSGQSPIKQASPPNSFTQPAPSLSPSTHQPPLKPTNNPMSPAVSPQKHNSPPQQPLPGHHSPEAKSVLLSAPKLTPSLNQTTSSGSVDNLLFSKPPAASPSKTEVAPTPALLPSALPQEAGLAKNINAGTGDEKKSSSQSEHNIGETIKI